jgi:deoxyribonuclease-4
MNNTVNIPIGGKLVYKDSLYKTLKSSKHKCNQVFLTPSIGYNVFNITDEDKEKCKNHCSRKNKSFVVHCPFNLNLASDDPMIRQKSLNTLRYLLRIIYGLPSTLILHIGKNKDIDIGLNNVIDSINILDKEGYLRSGNSIFSHPLLLENASGQGTEIGYCISQLAKLTDSCNIGICFDTQHAFASGIKINRKIFRISNLECIHLNDSMTDFGSNVDRHQSLEKGNIWKESNDSLIKIINKSIKRRIPIILETPEYEEDIYKAISYCK